jgi:hypothetical protein
VSTHSKPATPIRVTPRTFSALRYDDMAAKVDTEHGPAYRCIEYRCEGMVEGVVHHAHSKRAYLVWRSAKESR